MATFDIKELMTFADAATELQVSRQSVYDFIAKDLLHPLAIGSRRFLLTDEVATLKEKRNK